ncbi:NAD(P)/FAD-dependent oxidoreductase [Candidatus Nomurabacteria bacterium]|nr:NAD(P)/FAD-dependent oxidoreductase [Candidatus Nomurabacteria bacterium]
MRIAIIGGGAAGMMSAVAANENNPQAEVFLIERNDSLGKKVIISGGGRCNVTTGIEEIKLVLEKYPRGAKFLNSAIHNFPPRAVQDWFEEHGVPLKCEEDLRVFPASNKGTDVVRAFETFFAKHQTKVLFKHIVKSIEKENNSFIINFKDQKSLSFDKVILALGGQAYRQTGSAGDGYSLAEILGHQITELAPSLSSLTTKETWPHKLSGLSFLETNFKAFGQKKYQFSGPFVFTHWGISGPAIFALSSLLAFENFDQKRPLKIQLDLLPEKTFEQILAELKNFMDQNLKKSFKYALSKLVPLSLATIALEQNKIALEKNNGELSKQELRKVATWLKSLSLTIIDRRPGHEFVTAGGVELKEVNSSTMESKICPGLYFAGEILNIDGYTGGFNLQASWATGYLAGVSASKT